VIERFHNRACRTDLRLQLQAWIKQVEAGQGRGNGWSEEMVAEADGETPLLHAEGPARKTVHRQEITSGLKENASGR